MKRRAGRARCSGPLRLAAGLLGVVGLASVSAPGIAGAGRPGTVSAAPIATVSPAGAQTIDGFGASGAWWPNDLVRFPPAVQRRVGDLLFAPDGIDLSAYRYNIGGGGVGVTNPTRVAPTFLVRPGVYDWSADPGGTAFLALAHAHGVPVLEGFVNSAPSVWTTNHQSCGGQLTPGAERAYATYLAAVVQHFAGADGIRLTAVSPMNEPDNSFGSCGQEGMAVPVAQRSTVVDQLGRALAGHAPFARVIADESSLAAFQFLPEVPQWLTGRTPRWVGALVHHAYEFPTDSEAAQVASLGPRFGKPLWMTEICCYDGNGPLVGFGPQYDPGMTSGLWLADTIDQDLALIGDAQFDWWTALSDQLGCDPRLGPACVSTLNAAGWNDGLLYYDPAFATDGNHAIYTTKRYYVLGNFSRYVRPGAVRHPVSGVPSGLRMLAFDKGGHWSVVVINDTTTGAPVRVAIGFPKGVSLRPTGAVRTSAADSLAAVGSPQVSAAGVATVTAPPASVTTYTFTS